VRTASTPLRSRTAIGSDISSDGGRPVNIHGRRQGLRISELAELGVRRVSLASGLFTFAQQLDDGLARLAVAGRVDARLGEDADQENCREPRTATAGNALPPQ
jgi:hypothetical protein